MNKLVAKVAKAMRLGIGTWRDALRAGIELAIARRRLGSVDIRKLSVSFDGGQAMPPPDLPLMRGTATDSLPARVAYVIPRVALRVPWRSDCLVQAMAAQRWLAAKGLPSEICFGVRTAEDGSVEAHAWLRTADCIVTGGDISGYVPFAPPSLTGLNSL